MQTPVPEQRLSSSITLISMHVTVDVNFYDGLECLYVKYKAVHQQHVNYLINTWVFVGLNMAVNSVLHSFLCNNVAYTTQKELRCALIRTCVFIWLSTVGTI